MTSFHLIYTVLHVYFKRITVIVNTWRHAMCTLCYCRELTVRLDCCSCCEPSRLSIIESGGTQTLFVAVSSRRLSSQSVGCMSKWRHQSLPSHVIQGAAVHDVKRDVTHARLSVDCLRSNVIICYYAYVVGNAFRLSYIILHRPNIFVPKQSIIHIWPSVL